MIGPDLKPCPFCGGNNVRAFRHVPMQPDPCVMCRDCYASAVSVAAWNRRDPAVLDALPEVQALIAAAYEAGARSAEDQERLCAEWFLRTGKHENVYEQLPEVAGRIRAITTADATAALARIEREAEALGRVKGLRDAAGVCRKVRSSSADESECVGALDCASAILARAAEIEKEGGA